MKTIDEAAWIMQKAEEEDNAFTCAGGFLAQTPVPLLPAPNDIADRSVLAKFVELARRKRRLTKEQFANKTQIPLEEVVHLESQVSYTPRPRTIHLLAKFLEVPPLELLALAGLARPKDDGFQNAAIRFAAMSEPIRNLTPEENEALEEFVRFLSKR